MNIKRKINSLTKQLNPNFGYTKKVPETEQKARNIQKKEKPMFEN